MLANHRFEVGLENRALSRCKSIKLAEGISALRNVRRRKYDAKCVVVLYTQKCPEIINGNAEKSFLKTCSPKSRRKFNFFPRALPFYWSK